MKKSLFTEEQIVIALKQDELGAPEVRSLRCEVLHLACVFRRSALAFSIAGR